MRTLRTLAFAAVALLVVGLLLPRSAGGATEYVRTYGNSMEPTFRTGDLAVLRSASRYEVGDVVAYRSIELDQVVLHRIVERDGASFVFQGDNNDFLDSERLTSRDVIGKLALRIPRGGVVLSWLEHPLRAAGVAVALSVLPSLWTFRRRRRRNQHPTQTRGNPMKSFSATHLRRAAPWLAAGASALLLVGAVALTRPESTVIDNPATATHTGTFTYSAPSASSLYPEGFTTGDPVFTRLADQVSVVFEHQVDRAVTVGEDRTVRMDAVLSGPGGWRRTVPLVGTRPLEPPDTTVRATLDLPLLSALGNEAAAITGTAAGQLQVDVTAVVDLGGSSGSPAANDQFTPTLGFSLDASALRLTTPPAEPKGAIVETREVTTPGSLSQTALMSLLGAQLQVRQAALLGLAGGGILMSVAAGLAGVGFLRRNPADSIAARYGSLIVPISRVSKTPARRMVDVSTLADLVRVAKRHDQLVLCLASDKGHSYLVELPGNTYRYESCD